MLPRETTLPTLSLPALELLSRDPSDRTESFRTRAGICLPRVKRLPTSRNITQTLSRGPELLYVNILPSNKFSYLIQVSSDDNNLNQF